MKIGIISLVVFFVACNEGTEIASTALLCWRCSSNSTDGAFCDDPFDSSKLSEQEKGYTYVYCGFPPGHQSSTSRPVCRKMKQRITALFCWRCSTDSANSAFCEDPFDPSTFSEQQRLWSYANCSYSAGYLSYYGDTQPSPVCRKIVQKVFDRVVISRSCFWEDTLFKACSDSNPKPSYIETESCESCTSDGCNGASQYAPIAFLMIIPVILARMLQ
ncbi:uncharacterized protein LOC132261751 [Phlebotomus argentipes]|uniref:uncharacterized protein LOC132261751 n=1 Tax=Phlebotomus argentipes TaxID=94469 RepID=UPI002892D104|nr:uncharacterized protein LOC132261751 [Phlebotomus argentipes]